MRGLEWSCKACTFKHQASAPRCAMCGELRVTRDQMRDFVTGGASACGAGRQPQQDGATGSTNTEGDGVGAGSGGFMGGGNAGKGVGGCAGPSSSLPEGTTSKAPPSAASQRQQQQRVAVVINPYARKKSAPGEVGASLHRGSGGCPASTATDGGQPSRGEGQQQQRQPQQPQQQRVVNSYGFSGSSSAGPARQPQQQNQRQDQIQEAQTANPKQQVLDVSSSRRQLQPPQNDFGQNGAPCDGWRNPHQDFQPSQQQHRRQQQQELPARRPLNSVAAASSSAPAAAGGGGGPAEDGVEARQDNPFAIARGYSASIRGNPYKPGPVPLSSETASEWIYPINDDYPIRSYQLSISHSAIMQNTLVSLPTGLGKTLIAAVVMYNYYRWFPTGRVIFCAPTRPLVTQQIEACYRIMGIPTKHTAEISGRAKPESRTALWEGRRMFFCTPQTLQKDIAEGRCDARGVVCIVLDEAHKARGDYAYTKVVEQIEEAGAKFRVVGLSATPGTSIKAIQEVVNALRISKVDARTDEDPNVKKYIHERRVEIIKVKQSSEVTTIERLFNNLIHPHMDWLRQNNAVNRIRGGYATVTSFSIMQAQRDYTEKTNDHTLDGHFFALQQLVQIRNDLKISGIGVVRTKMERLRSQPSGMMRSIVKGKEFNTLWEAVVRGTSSGSTSQNAADLKLNNPKLQKLDEILREHFERARACGESSRAIVFSQWRDSVEEIVIMLNETEPLIRPRKFVGQSAGSGGNKQQSKESTSSNAPTLNGMKQSEQQEVIRQFREGKFNVIVCTCIGEEGLDIGEVDLIVNFDCLRSPIRMIQRTGRTGRKRAGRVVCLVAEGQEEQRLQSSTTATKMLGRALKDTRVFKLSKNEPLFPVPPALKKQNMAVQDDYRLSQVGGHSHKKKNNPASRNGPFIDNDKWRLRTPQENERKERFGTLTGTDLYRDATKQGCVFPPALRRKYLRFRMQAKSSRKYPSSITCIILRDFEESYLKQGLQRSRPKARLLGSMLSSSKVRPPSDGTSRHSLLNRDSSERVRNATEEGKDGEGSIADVPPLDADDDFPCDLSDASGHFGESFPAVNGNVGDHDEVLDGVFGSLQDLSIHIDCSKLLGDRIDSIFDGIDRRKITVLAPPRLADPSSGEYVMDEYCSMSNSDEEDLNNDQVGVPLEINEEPPFIDVNVCEDTKKMSDGPEVHISIPTDSSSSESDITSQSDTKSHSKEAAEVGPKVMSTSIDGGLGGAKECADSRNLPGGDGMKSSPSREARAPPVKEAETDTFCPIPESVFLPINGNEKGLAADHEDVEETGNAFRIATQDSSSSSSSSDVGEANDEAEQEEDAEAEKRESPKSITAANDPKFSSQTESVEAMPPPSPVVKLSTGKSLVTDAGHKHDPLTMEPGDAQSITHVSKGMTHSTEDTPLAFRCKPPKKRNVLLSPASVEERGTPSQATISNPLIDTPEKATSPTCDSKEPATSTDDIVCLVCMCASSPDSDPIVLCDGPQADGSCHVAVHKSCYGITVLLENSDYWRCEPCEELHKSGTSQQVARSTPTCSICKQAGGALRRTPKPESCWVHPVCMFWSPAYAHIALGKGKPVPEDSFCCKIQKMEDLRLASFDWKLNMKCSFCSLSRAVKCAGAGCKAAAHPHCARQRDRAVFWSLIHHAGRNADYDVNSSRALWHMFCPACGHTASQVTSIPRLGDSICQKCVYFQSKGEDLSPCIAKLGRWSRNTKTPSELTRKRRLQKTGATTASAKQDPGKRPRKEGSGCDGSQKENKASKREMLRQRVTAFFDSEAGIDPDEDAEGDAGEADEIRAIEEEEMSNDSFINDSSQLGYTQDALDLVDANSELRDVAHNAGRDASLHVYRELDNEKDRSNQFATPMLNRRIVHKNARTTPLSAPSSQRGLGNMAFIRSVIEHHKAGGEAGAIEDEYHKIALDSKLKSATSTDTQETNKGGNEHPDLQAATSSGSEPLAAPTGLSSGISLENQNRASRTNQLIAIDVDQGSSIEEPNCATLGPKNKAASIDRSAQQLHMRAPHPPALAASNNVPRGGGLTKEQKARIERNRQEALRRKQQRMQERMLCNNRPS